MNDGYIKITHLLDRKSETNIRLIQRTAQNSTTRSKNYKGKIKISKEFRKSNFRRVINDFIKEPVTLLLQCIAEN